MRARIKDDALAQLVLSGLVLGSIYALIAIGYVIIYKATSVVNFAQGDAVMVGAYIALTLYSFLHLPLPIVVLLTIALSAGSGAIIERVVYRQLLNAPVVSIIIATLAVGLILRSLVRIVFGPSLYSFPPLLHPSPIIVGELVTTQQNLLIFGIVIISISLLVVFFQRTRLGKAMRAVYRIGTPLS